MRPGFLRRNVLLWILFLTGAGVLIIEVAATRILAPYFGSTIYTFSSIIGTILAALSIGYYVGGKLADARPSLRWFFGLILAGGISVILLQVLAVTLLRKLGYSLNITTGPLISSLVLFFVPGALLGTLSPYGVKLQGQMSPHEGIGTVAGKVFFWSTMGSIFGSLAAGFILIPNFGVSTIVTSCGIALSLMGLIGMVADGLRPPAAVLLLAFVAGQSAFAMHMTSIPQRQVVVEVDGVYEKVVVLDQTFGGRPMRAMFQNRTAAGGMFTDTGEPAIDYPKYYAVAGLYRNIDNALVIGAGMYMVPRMILNAFPNAVVDVAEIEPVLYDISQKYCGLVPSPRLKNYTADGRRFLHDSGKDYDLIFSDAYVSLTVPPHLTTVEFLELVRERLAPDGVFVANFLGDFSRTAPSMIMSQIKTLQAVFPNHYFFAEVSPRTNKMQNFMAVAINGDKRIDFDATDGHADPIISGLRDHLIDLRRFELSPYPTMTDDYCPTEYLASAAQHGSKVEMVTVPFGGRQIEALVAQMHRYGKPGSSESVDDTRQMIHAELAALCDKIDPPATLAAPIAGNIIGSFRPDEPKRIQFVASATESPESVALLLEVARTTANAEPASAMLPVDFVFTSADPGALPRGNNADLNNASVLFRNVPMADIMIEHTADDQTVSLANRFISSAGKHGIRAKTQPFANTPHPTIQIRTAADKGTPTRADLQRAYSTIVDFLQATATQ